MMTGMKFRTNIALFPLVAAVCAIAAPASAATLAEVQQALTATTSMTADFTQTAANGAIARGRMQLKRPGKIRFDYGNEAKYLVVADGRLLSFVDYQVSQVSQWPIRSTPLGVLLDPKADLSRIAKVLPESEMPGQVAVQAADPKKPDYGRITFFLAPDSAAPGGLRLTGWRVVDAQNNLTTVELSNVKMNVAVQDSAFGFRDPRARLRPPGKTG